MRPPGCIKPHVCRERVIISRKCVKIAATLRVRAAAGECRLGSPGIVPTAAVLRVDKTLHDIIAFGWRLPESHD